MGLRRICLPFRRSVWWLGDEGIWLNGASRILGSNSRPRDFFEFHPPGGFVIVALWLKGFGQSFLSVRLLAILVLSLIATFTFCLCRRVSGSAFISVCLALTWLLYGIVLWPVQINHHWLTTLFSLIGFGALLHADADRDHARTWLILAGLSLGSAGMITPTRGAYAILAAMPLVATPRDEPGVLSRSPCLRRGADRPGNLGLRPGRARAGVRRRHRLYAPSLSRHTDSAVRQRSRHRAPGRAPVPVLPPAVHRGPRSAARSDRFPQARRLRRVCPGRLRRCFPRPDAVHIVFTLPLALLLVAFGVSRVAAKRSGWIAVAVVLAGCLLLLDGARDYHRMLSATADVVTESPRGPLAFRGDYRAPDVIRELARLPADARLAFYPYIPMLPFLAGHQNALRLDVFVPEYTTTRQYAQAVARPTASDYLVWERTWSAPASLRQVFPALSDPNADGKLLLETSFRRASDVLVEHGSYEIRRRNAEMADLCGPGLP